MTSHKQEAGLLGQNLEEGEMWSQAAKSARPVYADSHSLLSWLVTSDLGPGPHSPL